MFRKGCTVLMFLMSFGYRTLILCLISLTLLYFFYFRYVVKHFSWWFRNCGAISNNCSFIRIYYIPNNKRPRLKKTVCIEWFSTNVIVTWLVNHLAKFSHVSENIILVTRWICWYSSSKWCTEDDSNEYTFPCKLWTGANNSDLGFYVIDFLKVVFPSVKKDVSTHNFIVVIIALIANVFLTKRILFQGPERENAVSQKNYTTCLVIKADPKEIKKKLVTKPRRKGVTCKVLRGETWSRFSLFQSRCRFLVVVAVAAAPMCIGCLYLCSSSIPFLCATKWFTWCACLHRK